MASHSSVLVSVSSILLIVSLLIQVSDGRRVLQSTTNVDGICAKMVVPRGYKCEEHEVVTSDGYILSMQRIPLGRNGSVGETARRQPVLLQHGLMVDGNTWLMNSPEESLGFVLADNGFDVWISNFRGTHYSQRHVSLDPSSRSYWDWSWDELAANDLPATVNFVYNQTGQKLHYVGHSMGTLVALASLSEGRLVGKLKSAAFLSPIAYLSNMKTPLGIMAARAFVGEIVTNWLGVAEFNPTEPEVVNMAKLFCDQPGVNCFDFMTAMTGINCCLNSSTVDLFLNYEPQPTSTKTMVHFAQTTRDGILRKYDYENIFLNILKYGQITPPIYKLSDIPQNMPLFLSYGGQDVLSDNQDVQNLLNNDLKSHQPDKLSVQYVDNYAHADFIMAVNAKEIVYRTMISFFSKNNNN
ncbi:hypothetical protein LUZ60_015736 [Juncus effusus]|nr:hypothetical protein LUZ60_015736 [Juncus effusus]